MQKLSAHAPRACFVGLLCVVLLAPGIHGFAGFHHVRAALDGSHSRKSTTRWQARAVPVRCACLMQLAAWFCNLLPAVIIIAPRRRNFVLRGGGGGGVGCGRWGLRYKPAAYPRLVGWAPRGCLLRPGSLEQSHVACQSGEEVRESLQLRRIGSWECFGPDQHQNFTRAVWTCQSPAQILFTYDDEECHYIHEGRARVSVVSPTTAEGAEGDNSLEVQAGDCLITPAGARVCWDILSPIKKKTSCREPFRMVSQGWILAPPLASLSSSGLMDTEAAAAHNTRTLRRTMSASALIDTLQEGLSQRRLRKRTL